MSSLALRMPPSSISSVASSRSAAVGRSAVAPAPRRVSGRGRRQQVLKAGAITDVRDRAALTKLRGEFSNLTDFIPLWVKIAVAVALGLGTTIGWKRIVVTVGEKIGKSHLTYAQGASAEMVAMLTIGAADVYGLPVSTTHILSSGIAGTMAANRSRLQKETLRNILLAWSSPCRSAWSSVRSCPLPACSSS